MAKDPERSINELDDDQLADLIRLAAEDPGSPADGDAEAPPDQVGPAGDGDQATVSMTAPGGPGAGLPADAGDEVGAEALPRVPGYTVTGRLGAGGTAIVWRALQLSTHREVALKIISTEAFGSVKAQRRFEREVELAASLEHPNIARVYDSGQHEGRWYYAMQLVDGRPLDEYVAGDSTSKPTPQDVLALMRTICEAVQYAHQRGVIHRDLKPSNIFVTRKGVPYVLDFGLAKRTERMDAELTVTTEGDVAGTLPYMAPEQATGHLDQIDTRTDVYSLGIILLRLLVGPVERGGRPIRDLRGGYLAVLSRIAEEDITSLRGFSSKGDFHVDAELETILLKALARDRSRRYASAGELGKDLENYMRGEPLLARKPTTFYFLSRKMRKHKLGLAGTAALLLLAGAGAIGFYIHAIQAEQSRTFEAKVQALKQGQIAEIRAAQAGEQRKLALDTLNRLVFEVQARLSGAQGQTALRRSLLETAIEGLQQIARSAQEDSVRLGDRSMAAALLQVGDVLALAGQEGEARAVYRQALEAFEGLDRAEPGNRQARRDVIVAHIRLASMCIQAGDFDAAKASIQSAVVRLAQVARAAPDDPMLAYDQWALEMASGDLQTALKADDQACEHFRQAVERAQRLPDRRDLSGSLKRLGDATLRLGRPEQALKTYEQAVTIEGSLLAANTGNRRAAWDYSVSLAKLAESQFQSGDRAAARRGYQQSQDLVEPLAQGDPGFFDAHVALASNSFMLGRIEQEDGNFDRAAMRYERAKAVMSGLRQQGLLDGKPHAADLLDRAGKMLEQVRLLQNSSQPAQRQ